ncbi:dTTP/UTP pyrophosphatase [Candidatus Magnetomoraceae bacterium gMMP-15]
MYNQNKYSLILASQSPRRKYLLEQAGLIFSIIPSSIDEGTIPISSPEEYVKAAARAKAKDIALNHPETWIIGADTIVLVDNTILGKPASIDEARAMLKRLGGRIHKVLTGYCISCKNKKKYFVDVIITKVLFKDLSHEEIEWYVHTTEPFDKAGAYAIQGLGSFLVKSIEGSYTNVVGLPVCEVMEILIKEKIITYH